MTYSALQISWLFVRMKFWLFKLRVAETLGRECVRSHQNAVTHLLLCAKRASELRSTVGASSKQAGR